MRRKAERSMKKQNLGGRRPAVLMAAAALLAGVLLTAGGCGTGPSEEEIRQTVQALVDAAEPINEIFYGEGVPVKDYEIEEADGLSSTVDFQYVSVSEAAPYQSIEQIKEAAEQVFTEAYLAGVYESAFVRTEDLYPRYAEDAQGRLTRNVKQSFKSTDEWTEWDFSTLTVIKSTERLVEVRLEGTFAGRTETETLRLEKEADGWRLASPTY